jgi:hypothetical protein
MQDSFIHDMYIDQLGNSSWLVLSFDTFRIRRLTADWSFENMNPAMTPCVMLVYQILMYRHRKQIKKIQQTSSFINWIVAMVICFIIFPMC